jgi:hypothetical protein
MMMWGAPSAGDEVFLFNLGFRAARSYEVFLAAVPRNTDRDQQDRLLNVQQAVPQLVTGHGALPECPRLNAGWQAIN